MQPCIQSYTFARAPKISQSPITIGQLSIGLLSHHQQPRAEPGPGRWVCKVLVGRRPDPLHRDQHQSAREPPAVGRAGARNADTVLAMWSRVEQCVAIESGYSTRAPGSV